MCSFPEKKIGTEKNKGQSLNRSIVAKKECYGQHTSSSFSVLTTVVLSWVVVVIESHPNERHQRGTFTLIDTYRNGSWIEKKNIVVVVWLRRDVERNPGGGCVRYGSSTRTNKCDSFFFSWKKKKSTWAPERVSFLVPLMESCWNSLPVVVPS